MILFIAALVVTFVVVDWALNSYMTAEPQEPNFMPRPELSSAPAEDWSLVDGSLTWEETEIEEDRAREVNER